MTGNSKPSSSFFSLQAKLDISFGILFALVFLLYLVSYSGERIINDFFTVSLVLGLLATYYFLRQEIINPLSALAKSASKVIRGESTHLIEIEAQSPEYKQIVEAYNQMNHQNELAKNFISQIENGNLHAEITQTDGRVSSLLVALANMRDTLKKVEVEEDRRRWTAEGFAKLSEILRLNNQNVKSLTKEILAGLVPYLGANQGAIFLTQDEALVSKQDEISLLLTATYAYNRHKYLKETVTVGRDYAQGLVGQVFLEKAPLYLEQMPKEYLRISSGLGDASPSNVLLIPLIADQKNYGVMEIASFSHILPHQVKFIENISQSIALTINTVRINEKTKILLEESQRQGEQLKSQEEEMRQNVEELATTQEEMQRRQTELESQNRRVEANTQILQKALKQAKESEKMLQEKNQQILKQEDEMRQNMQHLEAIQIELEAGKNETEKQNAKMKVNEGVLKKALEKYQEGQKKLQEKNKELEQQEDQMATALQNLEKVKLVMEERQNELEAQTEKLKNNEYILKKFIDKANVSDAKLKAIIKEKDAIIENLKS